MNNLPEGWTWSTIAEVTQDVPNVHPGWEPAKEFGYIDISSINNSNYTITKIHKINGAKAPSRAKRPIQPGDVLFSNVRTYLRNIAIVPDDSEAQICSTGFTVLRSNGGVDSRYLFRWVLTDTFIDRVTPRQTGTHYPATSDRVIKSEAIPLPPLNEQRRIVPKLEKLLSRVDAAQARLATIPRILKRFRQSVLAAACSGRLTSDWREQHEHEEWQELTLSDVIMAKPKNGHSAKPVPYETPWRVLTLTATTSGIFDPRHFKHFDGPIREDSPLWLRPDDILVQRGNTIEYVGVPAVYDGPPNQFIYPDLMMRFRANSLTTTKFLYFALSWERTRSYLRERATGTAGSMPKINQSTLVEVPIDLPPLSEQNEIVRRVEELFKTADALEARYRTGKAHVDKLTQSILAKAFRGELVPQDPNDEPAALLIERLSQSAIHSDNNGSAEGQIVGRKSQTGARRKKKQYAY